MARQPVRITDEIFQIGGYGLTNPEDAAVYLIAFGPHAALVDAGCGPSVATILANIEAAGVRPEQIEALLLTHCHFDHTGGASTLRRLLGCPVIAHDADAGFIERGDDQVSAATWYGAHLDPCVVDRRLRGASEDILLGDRAITALHIPGHSPGSVAYLTASAGQSVVLAQDVHGPLHPSLLSSRRDYQASLQRLLDLHADILCEGHYGMFIGKDAVARFIRSFLDEP
jgi:glyoxylase-like metal-dependent hydrolase (beta-lactamase superfamily II)